MNFIVQFRWFLVAVAVFGLAACAANPLTGFVTGPATYNLKMDLSTGGFQRSYRVHIPKGYDGEKPLPLVVVIHGAFDTATGMERFSGFSRLADQEGFLVLYPNGIGILGYLQHWNAGHCCGKAAADNIDDIGYLEAAINDISTRLAVDRKQVYMAGFSNGGMLVHRFAAERGDLLAAAAPLSASIGGRPAKDAAEWRIPDPVKPLPLLVMHGRADDDIPYGGGHSAHRGGERTYWSVDESVRFWVKHNGCNGPPAKSSLAQGAVSIQTWETCRDQAHVALYTIEKWGHIWPGPYFTADLPVDDPLYNFDAAEIICNFFNQHALHTTSLKQ